MEDERIVSPKIVEEEDTLSLRPQYLKEYIGQASAKEMLRSEERRVGKECSEPC